MSRAGSSQGLGRRGKHRLGPRGGRGWAPGGRDEEAWAGPPVPRRGRWEPAGEWGAEGPGPGPPFPPGPWDWPPPPPPPQPPADWGPPPWDEPWGGCEPPGRRWGSPERAAQGPWDGPQGPEAGRRDWEAGEAGGRWAAAGRSPGRERRGLGGDARQEGPWSPAGGEPGGGRWGRPEKRGRDPRSPARSPARRQSRWGSPKREARQERSGAARHQARGPEEAGGRWAPPWGRERNRSREGGGGGSDHLQGERHSPGREARGQGSPARYRADEGLDGGGGEGGSRDRGGEEDRVDVAGSGRLEASDSFAGPISSASAIPTEWTPCDSVVQWWMQCQTKLSKKMGDQLRSICPRPTLPDRLSETPQINPAILSLLNQFQEKELRSAMYFSLVLQDEVLDMLAPAMTIYEMAEEAMEKDEPVDPMELREWSRRLIRFIGSINSRLTARHRFQVLSAINPRLRVVVSKMSAQSTKGMLFAEDKVKLLKEIVLRFPQLTQRQKKLSRRRFQAFNYRAASYSQTQKRPFLGSRSKPPGTGKRGKADQRAEQSHSQGARGQGPAEWH